ncbi:MAG: ABC transporter ATP-binding protein [Ilumatobacteraceae bacterium]
MTTDRSTVVEGADAQHAVSSSKDWPADGQPAIRLRNVCKTFRRHGGELVQAVDDISLDVAAGEFVVLLGPSGCGKTTLLRSVAGLEHPDSGEIDIVGQSVFSSARHRNLPPQKRPVSMVFQSYALWPHMTVSQNVGYPLSVRKVQRSEVRERVAAVLKAVGLEHLGSQHPSQLSGGQQQRIALARALVAGDQVVLFDEPLSNVDAKVRELLRVELLSMQAEFGFAALYVTHDQQEAMELANRIAVLNGGRVEQLASPTEVYAHPATRMVAEFVGKANVVAGDIVSTEGREATISTSIGPLHGSLPSTMPPAAAAVAVFRPEHAELFVHEPPPGSWAGRVVTQLFVAPHHEVWVELETTRDPVRVRVNRHEALDVAPGSACWVHVRSADCLILPDLGVA